jgi:hypothetical protein
MKGPLMTAVEPLEQSYSALHRHLKDVHDQPDQEIQAKVDQMKEILIISLRCEQPDSNKAVKVYESIQNLIKLYSRNTRDTQGQLICPISYEPINLDKPEENFYASVSSHVYKKASMIEWVRIRPFHPVTDPVNCRPYSRHEMKILRGNPSLMSAVQELQHEVQELSATFQRMQNNIFNPRLQNIIRLEAEVEQGQRRNEIILGFGAAISLSAMIVRFYPSRSLSEIERLNVARSLVKAGVLLLAATLYMNETREVAARPGTARPVLLLNNRPDEDAALNPVFNPRIANNMR